MDRLKEIVGRLWTRYRGLPMWGQVVIGIVLLSVIVGPFLSESEDATDDESAEGTTTTSEAEPETTTTREDPEETTTTEQRQLSLGERIEASNDGTLLIAEADLGDEWPLSVPDGLLSCRPVEGGDDLGAIVFGTDDTAYAINGIARGRADDEGWREIDEIWLDNPAIPGSKVDIGPLIDLGLRLCR